jgi:hypothetical protein
MTRKKPEHPIEFHPHSQGEPKMNLEGLINMQRGFDMNQLIKKKNNEYGQSGSYFGSGKCLSKIMNEIK